MCGIAGFTSTERLARDQAAACIGRMVETLRHRGPDASGTWVDTHAALGQARLSIIDLSDAGKQPMGNEDGKLQIVFNGEIYNFPGLRQALVAAGHVFSSHTDTEVLLHGYEEWGLGPLLERIEGMFAFALWDSTAERLSLARDHFGIKPLYYHLDQHGLSFASEPKGLIEGKGQRFAVDPAGFLRSLQHIGVPAPDTVYEGMRELEPATWLTWDAADGALQTGTYWAWAPEPEIDDPEVAERVLWEAVCRSVEKHLIADVPVGVFLSGGLDSSVVAAACAEAGLRPTCVTIGIDDPEYDETSYAAALCAHLGLPHQVERMGRDDARPFDQELHRVFDAPFASSAALSASYLTKITAPSFKVMLSGEGGDELFGGYSWYARWLGFYGAEGKPPSWWRNPRNQLRRLCGRQHFAADPLAGYARLMGAYQPRVLSGLLAPALLAHHSDAADASQDYARVDQPRLLGFDRMQSLDLGIFLPSVCLRKMDRCSMAVSQEVRVPLLDRTIADAVGRIAPSVRNPGDGLKGLFRRMAKGKLPDRVLAKRKQGFSTPIRRWFGKREILAEVEHGMANGDWWRPWFAKRAVETAEGLSGRPLWRFWHAWRWVREQSG